VRTAIVILVAQRAQTEDKVMKITRITKTLTLGMGLLLATSAFAGNKGNMKLFDTASAGGKQLPAGEYSVSWEGNGPTVDVNLGALTVI